MANAKRVAYFGVVPYANDAQMNRVQAFGSTGTFTYEDVKELANKGIVGYSEDIENVDVTIEALDYGSIADLNLLIGRAKDSETAIDVAIDLESACTDLYVPVLAPDSAAGAVWTQYIDRAYLYSMNMAYSVDGNFTESYTLQADNKTWYMNEGRNIVSASATGATGDTIEVSFAAFTGITEIPEGGVLAVFYNNEWVDPTEYEATIDGTSVDIEFVNITLEELDTVRCRVACDAPLVAYSGDADAPAALRRGHIEIEFWRGHTSSGASGAMTTGDGAKINLNGLQSLSVDVSLERRMKRQLGTLRVTDRPLQIPIGVDISLEIDQEDILAFARFANKNVASDISMSVRDFDTATGIIIKLYEETDIAGHSTLLKTIEIPTLVPNDEAWNLSTDADATQTLSFRSHAIRIS